MEIRMPRREPRRWMHLRAMRLSLIAVAGIRGESLAGGCTCARARSPGGPPSVDRGESLAGGCTCAWHIIVKLRCCSTAERASQVDAPAQTRRSNLRLWPIPRREPRRWMHLRERHCPGMGSRQSRGESLAGGCTCAQELLIGPLAEHPPRREPRRWMHLRHHHLLGRDHAAVRGESLAGGCTCATPSVLAAGQTLIRGESLAGGCTCASTETSQTASLDPRREPRRWMHLR